MKTATEKANDQNAQFGVALIKAHSRAEKTLMNIQGLFKKSAERVHRDKKRVDRLMAAQAILDKKNVAQEIADQAMLDKKHVTGKKVKKHGKTSANDMFIAGLTKLGHAGKVIEVAKTLEKSHLGLKVPKNMKKLTQMMYNAASVLSNPKITKPVLLTRIAVDKKTCKFALPEWKTEKAVKSPRKMAHAA